ncbi:ferritin-like metal-binding protein YciE [Pseudorhizobium tarimense]|uniref:Ferritin-like metal-binding protein YciE n=1 Tax=Pseudorhizobium tarimense TaxID=1079109 RepID=A0ABV2HAC3_9HYPH|nr:DUF892 family protein [Pseudorhizobium tarimense]MCJ8520493.1 ferritin-like domain-containing protein [Pseudorhizobium tarimense]
MEQHILETEGQITCIEELLESLDESHSSLKDMALPSLAPWPPRTIPSRAMKSLKTHSRTSPLKIFEIAAYKSLMTIAELGGFPSATSALQANLQEEQTMAEWLDDNLRAVTVRFAGLREREKRQRSERLCHHRQPPLGSRYSGSR